MTISANTVIKYFMLLFFGVAGLYFAKEFLIPLAIGAIIATLFLPFCKWLEQKKLPRIVAVFICVLILLLFIAGFFTLIGWQISSLTNDIELIKTKSVFLIEKIQQYIFKHFGFSSAAQTKLINDQQNSFTVYF